MKEVLVKEYNNLVKIPKTPLLPKNEILINFLNGAKVEITGKNPKNDSKILYMIGILKHDNWNHKTISNFDTNNSNFSQLIGKDITPEEEFNLTRKFLHFLKKRRIKVLYVWGSFEDTYIKVLCDRYPNLQWSVFDHIKIVDVYSWILKENIAFPGATTFTLKNIGKALYDRNIISTTWEENENDVHNGMDAMMIGNEYYKSKCPKILKNLKSYNKADVVVMKEICELFMTEGVTPN